MFWFDKFWWRDRIGGENLQHMMAYSVECVLTWDWHASDWEWTQISVAEHVLSFPFIWVMYLSRDRPWSLFVRPLPILIFRSCDPVLLGYAPLKDRPIKRIINSWLIFNYRMLVPVGEGDLDFRELTLLTFCLHVFIYKGMFPCMLGNSLVEIQPLIPCGDYDWIYGINVLND